MAGKQNISVDMCGKSNMGGHLVRGYLLMRRKESFYSSAAQTCMSESLRLTTLGRRPQK